MAATMLLQKRKTFGFEKEIRLLWLENAAVSDEVYIPIEPNIIKQVMCTPHVKPAERAYMETEFAKRGVGLVPSKLLDEPAGW